MWHTAHNGPLLDKIDNYRNLSPILDGASVIRARSRDNRTESITGRGPGYSSLARIGAVTTTLRIVRPRLRSSGRRDGVIRGVSFHIKRIMRAPARSLKQSAMRGMRFGKGIILVGGCLSFFLLPSPFFPPFLPLILSLSVFLFFLSSSSSSSVRSCRFYCLASTSRTLVSEDLMNLTCTV